MSSTNRSRSRDAHVSDYYVTPHQAIQKVVDILTGIEPTLLTGPILDPAAGGDAKHAMSYPYVLQRYFGAQDIDTVDIRQDSLAAIKADYLFWKPERLYRLIITNPPFALAREFFEKAILEVEEGGFVVLLLRLNFLEGNTRRDLWRRHMPKYIFVHHRRFSFTDDGNTDSIAYAHFVWQRGYCPAFSLLQVI